MKRSTLLLALLVSVGGPAAFAAPPNATNLPTASPHDAQAVDFLRALETTIQKQSDEEAVTSVKRLVALWKDPGVRAETKKPIPGLVAWYARRKPVVVALAGIEGLADIGKGEGATNLVAVMNVLLDREGAPEEPRKAVFAALKKVADPDPAVTSALVKLFVHKDDAVAALAADAVGGYRDAPVALRRDLFEELLKRFEGLESTAIASGKIAVRSEMEKWAVLRVPVMESMGALAKHPFATMAEARKWFNDHKKDAAAWG
jgi:hypothetical protein